MVLDGIARLLAERGVADYQPTGVYNGAAPAITFYAVPPEPDRLVVLTLYPGPEAEGMHTDWRLPRLQVRTRAGGNPLDALQLDSDVCDVLHQLRTTLPDGTHLTDCYALSDAPQSMGQDTAGRWELSRNYQLTID